MQATEFIWKNGKMIAWKEAKTHVLTHALHYGSAAFEGIRVYSTHKGSAIFKLQAHIDRLFYSAKQLSINIPYSKENICQAAIETVAKNRLEEGYIRPFVFYGYGDLKVVPQKDTPVEVVIACWPWDAYLPVNLIDVVTSSYIRMHPKSIVADAKISGHYVNSILAGLALRNTPYHEALLLDAEGFVAECTASNIFIVKNATLITPPQGTILVGITRSTVIEIANELGLSVEERLFYPHEIYDADEVFCCGTAIELAAVRSLDDKIIAHGKMGKITQRINTRYQQIVHGQAPEYEKALSFVDAFEEVAA